MKWNWQQKDWPQFKYDQAILEKYEKQFLLESGILLGIKRHLKEQDKDILIVEILTDEAQKTSEIEGEYLNRESVQSSIMKQFGLKTENRKITPAETGISEMMIDLYQNFAQPLTHEKLFSWHEMIMKGRQDLEFLGEYRKNSEPMQIISGSLHDPKVHFEAPSSIEVPKQMDEFIHWFNNTSPSGKAPLPPLVRAGITHLYFICIHPFEDGNGRIGRAISEKALSQNIGEPILIACSRIIEKKKSSYYNNLEKSDKSNEITSWLRYFSETILEAQQYTEKWITFLINKTKFYDNAKGQLNERQEKVIARIFAEGIEGFKGGLSAEKYVSITKTSRATATRDLQDLVDKGFLNKKGLLKSTRYYLNL
ncbi:MAG: DUF4172 domain-containing protein [Verrucomicrobia bacterium]|nr:MAG: DUF4172 domain-containing protein [Verrucomicrobiota bacterium]